MAFNQMRTRIKRFLKQRTDMLAGVSHDLRTSSYENETSIVIT